MDKIEEAAGIITQSQKIVVFTGAGMSTESGIPDFRSPGGIWDQFDPNELTYQKFLTTWASREKYWERLILLRPLYFIYLHVIATLRYGDYVHLCHSGH